MGCVQPHASSWYSEVSQFFIKFKLSCNHWCPSCISAGGNSSNFCSRQVCADTSLECSAGLRGKYCTAVVKNINCQDDSNKPRIFSCQQLENGTLQLSLHLVVHLAQAGYCELGSSDGDQFSPLFAFIFYSSRCSFLC